MCIARLACVVSIFCSETGVRLIAVYLKVILTHTGHDPTAATDGLGLPLLPEIKAEVKKLVEKRVPMGKLREEIRGAAEKLMVQLGLQVESISKQDRRFFPDAQTLRNIKREVLRDSRYCAKYLPTTCTTHQLDLCMVASN